MDAHALWLRVRELDLRLDGRDRVRPGPERLTLLDERAVALTELARRRPGGGYEMDDPTRPR